MTKIILTIDATHKLSLNMITGESDIAAAAGQYIFKLAHQISKDPSSFDDPGKNLTPTTITATDSETGLDFDFDFGIDGLMAGEPVSLAQQITVRLMDEVADLSRAAV